MTPAGALDAGIAALGLDLPGGSQAKLLAYLSLLEKWNRVYNLTAIRDLHRMVSHHLLDSLAVVQYFSGKRVLDVGSGAGLPGIPLAIARPDLEVVLVDPVAKKTAFLTQAKTELGLANLTVVTGRVESLDPAEPYDEITSRAFAALDEFIRLTRPLLAPRGRWLAMKGAQVKEEIRQIEGLAKVSANIPIRVPGLDAERHLTVLEPIQPCTAHT